PAGSSGTRSTTRTPSPTCSGTRSVRAFARTPTSGRGAAQQSKPAPAHRDLRFLQRARGEDTGVIPIRDTVPTRTFPIVTVGLIFANFAVFLWERSGGQFDRHIYRDSF